MITAVVVWWQFLLLKKWTKVGAKFFFDSERLILVLVQRPTASKNGRSFHGEVVTFMSVTDISEARFLMQLCF
jgi:hypothetical protein